MHITCEGRSFDLFDGASPQNLWNIVRGSRNREEAVLADCSGEILDFQTPFTKDCDVKWIPLSSKQAYQAYRRTAIMLLVCAVKEVYGEKADVKVKHSLGKSIYCEFKDGHTPLAKELGALEKRMEEIVSEHRKITKLMVGRNRAIAFLRMKGRLEDAELLSQLDVSELNVDQCGSLIDYYFGPMLPDMGFIRAFALHSYAPGFLLQIPGPGETKLTPQEDDPLYARVFLETQDWSELIGCHNLEELNRSIDDGSIYDIVATAEALQEKKMAQLADTICGQKLPIRLVCMAGPSSSGKTTFMKRLIVHLWVNGVRPVILSLDDYFRNRDEMGNENWENLEALDLPLFEDTVSALLEGRKVHLPHFNFITGKKEWEEREVQLGKGQPILVEGLHALNPKLTYFVPGYQCLRVYLSALTQLTINDHNRISTSDSRLLRRLVRDFQFRGNGPEHTLLTWDNVRKGEERNIFQYQNRANVVFNTALLYEIPVLKKLARPLLESISPKSPAYAEALRMLQFLRPFRELDASIVPGESLLREFVGYKGVGKSFLNR